jgi:hypothetical protein
MSNCILAWDNAVTDGLTFYNWPASYDATLANLRTTNLSEKWLTTDDATTSTRFDCMVGNGVTTPTVALFALCNHNLSLAATVRITGSDNAWSSTTYDSGTLAAYPTGTTEASRAGLRWNFWHRLSSPTAKTRWRFEITDTSNPSNYVTAGRLFAARSLWQPTINLQVGTSLGPDGGADIQTALNGAEWFTERQPFRAARFTLQTPSAEMLSNGMRLMNMAAGSNREVFFLYDPADTEHSVARSMLARLRKPGLIEEPAAGRMKTAFDLKELL